MPGALSGAVWWVSLGCAAGTAAATGSQSPARVLKDTTILHEDCPLDEGDEVDLNRDGKADRITVMSDGRALCWALDLNFDGEVDDWAYTADGGQVRRRETDFDRDGRIDEVSLYSEGRLTEKRNATKLTGKWDTWHYYTDGKVNLTERDGDGDGYIDQWWEYPEGQAKNCPLIHSDVDGDGRPDPGATINLCRDEEVATDVQNDNESRPSPTELPDVPTETSVVPDEEQGGGER